MKIVFGIMYALSMMVILGLTIHRLRMVARQREIRERPSFAAEQRLVAERFIAWYLMAGGSLFGLEKAATLTDALEQYLDSKYGADSHKLIITRELTDAVMRFVVASTYKVTVSEYPERQLPLTEKYLELCRACKIWKSRSATVGMWSMITLLAYVFLP